MKLTDSRGLPVSTQSVAALERYELAARPAGDPDRATYRLLPRRYLLGMRAFSLEVTANYSRAEDFGRHALIAYNAAGRDEHQRRMLAKLEKSADGVHINANITRELGLPRARSIVAMASGRHAAAVELLLPVRSRMNRISGSHAQRDLVQLTCIEATLRCGNGRLARALASERTEQKPTSPFNWELTARALDVSGNAAAVKPVREHAELRRRAQLRRSAA